MKHGEGLEILLLLGTIAITSPPSRERTLGQEVVALSSVAFTLGALHSFAYRGTIILITTDDLHDDTSTDLMIGGLTRRRRDGAAAAAAFSNR